MGLVLAVPGERDSIERIKENGEKLSFQGLEILISNGLMNMNRTSPEISNAPCNEIPSGPIRPGRQKHQSCHET